jgi:hypothetical protein
VLAGLLLLPALAVTPARAAETVDRNETAHCIAVMRTTADGMVRQVKAGDRSVEPALRTELERAAALIGRTYLDGLQDEAEAKARLKRAQDEQATWSDARRNELHQSCVRKADAELAAANAAQRFIVQRVAQARFQRLMSKP